MSYRGSRASRRISSAHVRALAAPGQRSVLVLTDAGLRVVTPDQVFDLAAGGCRVLCTRADLLDASDTIRVAGTGGLAGPVAAVAGRIAADLRALLAQDAA